MSTLLFYDYLLTLQDEVSKLLVMTLDYTLIPGTGPIYVGRKEKME